MKKYEPKLPVFTREQYEQVKAEKNYRKKEALILEQVMTALEEISVMPKGFTFDDMTSLADNLIGDNDFGFIEDYKFYISEAIRSVQGLAEEKDVSLTQIEFMYLVNLTLTILNVYYYNDTQKIATDDGLIIRF